MTENEELRVLLFLAHSNGGGYSDDGELQDTSAEPHIDWKRDSVASIKAALDKRAVAFFEAEGITPDMIKESLKTGKPVRGKTAARVAELEAERDRLREALEWYRDKVSLCAMIVGKDGDDARHSLSNDRGIRANEALQPKEQL